jgi:hypothetical protein
MDESWSVRLRPKKCWTGLNKYLSFENAERAFDIVQERVDEPMTIIKCDMCDGFHIVRREPN